MFFNLVNEFDPEHGPLGPSQTGETEPTSTLTTLRPGQVLKHTGFRVRGLDQILSSHRYRERVGQIIEQCFAQDIPVPRLDLTLHGVTRWKMAWREIQRSPPSKNRMVDSFRAINKAMVKRCKDWPDTRDMVELPIAVTFSAAALIYGGLHALAWHAYFKSPIEQLLWRISACVVMGGMPLLLLSFKLDDRLRRTFRYLTTFIHRDLHEFIYVVLMLLLFSAYVLARAYLVVECFISLAHLPAEVYDVPSWASYFPHIS